MEQDADRDGCSEGQNRNPYLSAGGLKMEKNQRKQQHMAPFSRKKIHFHEEIGEEKDNFIHICLYLGHRCGQIRNAAREASAFTEEVKDALCLE